MVESNVYLDNLFYALADATRRSILDQVSKNALTIGQIAEKYKLTYAAISKHIQVLERAELVIKQRQGKSQLVILNNSTLEVAKEQIESYADMWHNRFNNLDDILNQ